MPINNPSGGEVYLSYIATLLQSGIGDPVATVIYNTLPELPVWSRQAVGQYVCQVSGDIFTAQKTVILCTSVKTTVNQGLIYARLDDPTFFFVDTTTLAGVAADDILDGGVVVEVKVYP